MIKLIRGPKPEFWTSKRVKKWTKGWAVKVQKGKEWKTWPRYQNQGINEAACAAMESWHYGKCAFCEVPLGGHREIEHFRSKKHHPRVAFIWENLFLICAPCNQNKGDKDYKGCLKPDRDDPADYLWINPYSLQMEPKPGISAENRARAIKTIELYKLDRPELTKLYELYIVQHLRGGPMRDWLLLSSHLSTDAEKVREQTLLREAQLRALADDRQPFSFMMRHFLGYLPQS